MGMIILFFGFIYCLHVALSVLGIYVIDRINLSDITFDLKSDALKMVFCSLFELGLPFLVFLVLPRGLSIMILAYIIVFWVVTKIAYLDITGPELLILGAINILGLIVAINLAAAIIVKVS